MEVSRMQEYDRISECEHFTHWDDIEFVNKLDFSYESLLYFGLNPSEWPVLNNYSVSQGHESVFSSLFEEVMQVPDETQTDLMEFLYDNELFNLQESPLWNDSIAVENGLLGPCAKTELPSKPEDSVKIEEPPHDSDVGMVDVDGGEEDFSNTSSETVNGSNALSSCREESLSERLFPCNVDSVEYKGLLLVHLLTACAEATSNGAHELVDIMLARLRELVSPTGFTMARVAYYLFQALQHNHRFSVTGDMEAGHFINSNGASEANFLGAFSLLHQVYPYIKIAHSTANQSILEAIPAQTQKVIHIIDFDIMEGMQWAPLMETLKTENYEIGRLKITSVKWDEEEEYSGPFSCCCKETGRRLSDYASSMGIPFSFQETELENVKNLSSSSEDEIVIVNCMGELPHMFERSRNQLLQFLQEARELDPAILTVGTGPNGIVAHGKLNFVERFALCLKNLCAVFDSVEAGLGEQYGLARAMVEHLFFGPMLCRPVNYMLNNEEAELFRVTDIPLKFGFAEGVMSEKNILYAKHIVSCGNDAGKYFDVESSGNNQLFLKWDSTPLICVSTWNTM